MTTKSSPASIASWQALPVVSLPAAPRRQSPRGRSVKQSTRRLPLIGFVLRFLERVPQRHVEIIDLAAGHDLSGQAADLAKVHAEAFRRQRTPREKSLPHSLRTASIISIRNFTRFS